MAHIISSQFSALGQGKKDCSTFALLKHTHTDIHTALLRFLFSSLATFDTPENQFDLNMTYVGWELSS